VSAPGQRGSDRISTGQVQLHQALHVDGKLKHSQKQGIPETHTHMAGTGAAPTDLHDALGVEPKLVHDLHCAVAVRP